MNTQLIKTCLVRALGSKFTAYLQAFRFVFLILKGRNPDPEFKLMPRFLKKGDIAVDVGANGANWTYVLHSCVGKGGFVYAFEADPYYAMATDIAIKVMRLKGAHLFPFGLSDKNEECALRVSNEDGLRYSGLGYVDREADKNDKGTELVKLVTLDSMTQKYPQILKTALIKCDVEGFELYVFKGASEVLTKARPVVILEAGNYDTQGYSAKDLYDFFESRNYLSFAMIGNAMIAETNSSLDSDKTISVNRILIPLEKIGTVNDLIHSS